MTNSPTYAEVVSPWLRGSAGCPGAAGDADTVIEEILVQRISRKMSKRTGLENKHRTNGGSDKLQLPKSKALVFRGSN